MNRIFGYLILITFLTLNVQAQTSSLSIKVKSPTYLYEGDQLNCAIEVVNAGTQEQSGQLFLSLVDPLTGNEVGGWFQLVFPNQFFTAQANTSSSVFFPIKIPYGYYRNLQLNAIATNLNAKDTLANYHWQISIISTKKRKTVANSLLLEKDTLIHHTIPELTNLLEPTTMHEALFFSYAHNNEQWAKYFLTEWKKIQLYSSADSCINALMQHYFTHFLMQKSIITDGSNNDTIGNYLLKQLTQKQQLNGGFSWLKKEIPTTQNTLSYSLPLQLLLSNGIIEKNIPSVTQILTKAFAFCNNYYLHFQLNVSNKSATATALQYLVFGALHQTNSKSISSVYQSLLQQFVTNFHSLSNNEKIIVCHLKAILNQPLPVNQCPKLVEIKNDCASTDFMALFLQNDVIKNTSIQKQLLQQLSSKNYISATDYSFAICTLLKQKNDGYTLSSCEAKAGNIFWFFEKDISYPSFFKQYFPVTKINNNSGSILMQCKGKQKKTPTYGIISWTFRYDTLPRESQKFAIKHTLYKIHGKKGNIQLTNAEEVFVGDTLLLSINILCKESQENIIAATYLPANTCIIGTTTNTSIIHEKQHFEQADYWYFSQLKKGNTTIKYQLVVEQSGSFSAGQCSIYNKKFDLQATNKIEKLSTINSVNR